MKIIDLLVFKSPTRIDWPQTRWNIYQFEMSKNPDGRASELSMSIQASTKVVEKFVRQCGVAKLYAHKNKQLSSDSNLTDVELR